MDGFITNVKDWLVNNISSFMTNLVCPIGALLLIAAAVVSVIMGILKMRSKQDDFKVYFLVCFACVAGAVLLGSIWIWGRAAAGV